MNEGWLLVFLVGWRVACEGVGCRLERAGAEAYLKAGCAMDQTKRAFLRAAGLLLAEGVSRSAWGENGAPETRLRRRRSCW